VPEPRLPADSMTAGQGLRKLEERGRRGRLFYRPLADTCDGPAWGHIRTVDGGSASRPAPRTGPVAGAGIEPLHPATGVTETQAQPARPGRLPLARRSERALSTRGGCHTRSTEPLQKGRTEFLRTTAVCALSRRSTADYRATSHFVMGRAQSGSNRAATARSIDTPASLCADGL